MNVSIFSDASYDDVLCVGGWGGWAKSDRGIRAAGGALKVSPGNVEEAEGYAMANAIAHAFRTGIAHPGDRIVVAVDNDGVLGLMNGERRVIREWQVAVLEFVRGYADRNDASFEYRHVKAHRRHAGGRHFVNDICDRLAKEGLAEARKRCEAGAVGGLLP